MSAAEWSRAFARQARSDLEARDQLLRAASLPQCHQLHYLQMALEKIAKSRLIAAGADPAVLQTSHAYIAKTIPLIVREMLERSPGQDAGWVVKAIRGLARDIELLAPSVDAGGAAPANCEYPWKGEKKMIVAPLDHDFKLDLIFERAGVTMMKAVRARVDELAGEETA
jgi:hypothetical protein